MATDWWLAGQHWLEREARKEGEAQLAAHLKRGRARSTFRYFPPDWHRDMMAALGRNDEEAFKALKLQQLGSAGLPPLRKRNSARYNEVPNFDAETEANLWKFWKIFNRPGRKDAAALFGGTPSGYIRAAKDLANYASNKATAMHCRERGEIQAALTYEAICDRIYEKLPAFARW